MQSRSVASSSLRIKTLRLQIFTNIPRTHTVRYNRFSSQTRKMISLPSPFSEIFHHSLTYDHPSPIHPIIKLSASHGDPKCPSHPQIKLWAKREDQASPLACSGNKYRKFEYIVPTLEPFFFTGDPTSLEPGPRSGSLTKIDREKDVTTLVTEGGIQSNHTVQISSLARFLNLECVLLLSKNVGGLKTSSDPESFLRTGNVQINKLLGSEIRFIEEEDTADGKDPLIPLLEELRSNGKNPYWIPSGASMHPLGGLGYARCAFEIYEQEQSMKKKFDYIFVACGSGSTFAGLIAGFKLLEKVHPTPRGSPTRQIIGILISPTMPKSYHEERILKIARGTAGRIGLNPEKDIIPEDIRLDDRFVGSGYGVLDEDTKATMEMVAKNDSLILDPVYTAKVMRGCLTWVGDGEVLEDWRRKMREQEREVISSWYYDKPDGAKRDINVLFIHTGGSSSLSAYPDI